MKIALVHYHLRSGGVTRVIEAPSTLLQKAGHPHVVLSGDPAGTQLPHVHLYGLDYARSENYLDPEVLTSEIRAAATEALGGPPDLWHFHNHSIGLNPALSQIPARLAADGHRLLLQTHDFAEDGRPANFQALVGQNNLFPLAPQVHYAFINTRDLARLKNCGLASENAHYLPNAVNAPAIFRQKNTSSLVFNPTRAIRRKNVGETLLLTALAPPGTHFAFALPPLESADEAAYRRWQNFAKELDLPIDFEVVGRLTPPSENDPSKNDFATWLGHSTHLLTTSIAEGFGLSFLEAAALGIPLIGRDLPEITRDFTPKSGRFKNLYQSLPIPKQLIDQKNLRQLFPEKITSYFSKYAQTLNKNEIETAWQKFTADDSVDFGKLPESEQEKLIRHALKRPEDFPIRHDLQKWLIGAEPDDLPAQKFSMDAHGKNLIAIYRAIQNSAITKPTALLSDRVLAEFLHPKNFHFLRS